MQKPNTPTANTVDQIEAVAKAALFADNFLRILGRSGAGKTTLAAKLAKALSASMADRVKLVKLLRLTAEPSDWPV